MTRPDAPGAGHTDTVRQRRRISRALDQLCAPPVNSQKVEPDWSQFAMGWPERTAAGIALREAA